LFLPQNDSHAETAVLLGRELSRRGTRSVALDLDGVYHQGTEALLERMPVVSSGLATDRPFYRLPPIDQMRVVSAARPSVAGWLADVDAVVAFNDGALQRLVLAAARRRGIQTDLVLDGMVTYLDTPRSPRSVARQILRMAGRRLSATGVGAFFPSEVGLAAVDRTHVAGEHSATVLRSRGSRASQVLASGLPRWPDAEWDAPTRVVEVLYLTGAFRWHDDQASAVAQERDVAELAATCHELGLSLTVRVHPRDDVDRYAGINATLVDSQTESMTATIRRSHLVMSIISVGLIEAILLGKPSRVLAIHPAWSRYRRAFVADPLFGPIRDIDNLRLVLVEMAAGIDVATLDSQRDGLVPYVAATGAAATQRIAAAIDGTP
jgi:hypothetical protein